MRDCNNDSNENRINWLYIAYSSPSFLSNSIFVSVAIFIHSSFLRLWKMDYWKQWVKEISHLWRDFSPLDCWRLICLLRILVEEYWNYLRLYESFGRFDEKTRVSGIFGFFIKGVVGFQFARLFSLEKC